LGDCGSGLSPTNGEGAICSVSSGMDSSASSVSKREKRFPDKRKFELAFMRDKRGTVRILLIRFPA
jgi:hypothetical protein